MADLFRPVNSQPRLPQSQRRDKTNKFGLASLLLGIAAVVASVAFSFGYFRAPFPQLSVSTGEEPSTNAYFAILTGASNVVMPLLALSGLVTGVIGLLDRHRSRTLAAAGAATSGTMLASVLSNYVALALIEVA